MTVDDSFFLKTSSQDEPKIVNDAIIFWVLKKLPEDIETKNPRPNFKLPWGSTVWLYMGLYSQWGRPISAITKTAMLIE